MKDSQQSPLSNTRNSTTTTIPFDITIEILTRLPAKSLIRFQAVSKLWFSTIRNKDFANSFLTRSRTRPRLLFTFKHFDSGKRFIFSAPEKQNNDDDDDKSSTIIARHEMTISGLVCSILSRPVNGFLCCIRGSSIAVCNPTTRQLVKLPDMIVEPNGRDVYTCLGYDPVQDQYKVLCVMMYDGFDASHKDIEQEHFVFTLSSQQKEWRKIETINGDPYGYMSDGISGVCFDGAVYYAVGDLIARFDVRSEKIDFIQVPKESGIGSKHHATLLNYNGKLGGVDYSDLSEEMRLWILEDAEKHECSSMTCGLPSDWEDLLGNYARSYGEICSGELMVVYPRLQSSKPFSVCYYVRF